MPNRKTNLRQYQRTWQERQRAAGKVPFQAWVTPQERDEIKALLESLRGSKAA